MRFLFAVSGLPAVALIAALASGCLDSGVSTCASGLVCAPGTVCYESTSECLLPEQLSACAAKPDAMPCSFPSTPAGLCRAGVCRALGCGDGVVSEGEDCDGGQLADATCLMFGYTKPDGLACDAACRYDVGNCLGFCGDGEKTGEEPCDGTDLGAATCTDLGFYNAPGLKCSPSACLFDTADCTGFCNDGIRQIAEGEICDTIAPPGQTCLDYGFDRGVLSCSQFCAPGFLGCAFMGWQNELVSDGQLTAIWGTHAANIFATTRTGTVAHHDGLTWTETQVAGGRRLNAVHGVGDEVFVVGQDGVIVRFAGGTWGTMTSGTSEELFGVWARATNDVYAVGANGTILRYDGTSWAAMASNTGSGLYSVWGDATSTLAVGDFGTIARNAGDTGGIWTVTSPALGGSFRSIWGVAANDIWAVGNFALAHFDGTQWTQLPSLGSLNGVWSDGSGGWFAVGGGGAMWFFDGNEWIAMESGSGRGLAGVWGSSVQDVFVAEAFSILRYDGGGVASPMPFTGVSNISDLHGDGTSELMLVAVDNNIYRFDGISWSAEDTGFSLLRQVWAASDTDVFAATVLDGIIHWDGVGWTRMTLPGTERILGLWGATGTDVFAVGASGTILHYDGSVWTAMASGTAEWMTSVWGTSGSDVWAVGEAGTVLHYNGTEWTGQSLGVEVLVDVWGSGASDVYAVGGRAAYHYDGTSWQSVEPGLDGEYTHVTGTGRDDVFFAGGQGMVIHFDGTSYTPVRIGPDVTTVSMFATERDVFVANTRGEVHRLLRTSAW